MTLSLIKDNQPKNEMNIIKENKEKYSNKKVIKRLKK